MWVIFVDAVLTTIEFGRANMECIPRKGEIVELDLSTPWVSRDPLHIAVFKVDEVRWEAKNTEKKEEWMHPWNSESEGDVTLRVWADDDDTKKGPSRNPV